MDTGRGGITEWDTAVRCLSRIAAFTRGMLVTSSHTRPAVPARTLARVRERIEHTNEMCRVSLGCILALGSLFFLSLSLLALLLLLSSPRFFFFTRHLPFALARVAGAAKNPE